MSYLDAKDLSRAMLVSLSWYQISSYPLLWKRLYLQEGWSIAEDLMVDFENRLRQLETRIQSRNPLPFRLHPNFGSDLPISADDALSIHTHDEDLQSSLQDCTSIYDQFFNTLVLLDRKSTRLNSSHRCISYAVFCLKKKKTKKYK